MVERITFTSAPARFNGGGGTISLRLGLKGYAAEGGHSSRATAEMGQIDRRRRRRGCARRLPPRTLAPANRLDKTLSIDGPGGAGSTTPGPTPNEVCPPATGVVRGWPGLYRANGPGESGGVRVWPALAGVALGWVLNSVRGCPGLTGARRPSKLVGGLLPPVKARQPRTGCRSSGPLAIKQNE